MSYIKLIFKERKETLRIISISAILSISFMFMESKDLFAQSVEPPTKVEGKTAKAVSRTLDQMNADSSLPVPVLKPEQLPFRPAMDASEYKAYKDANSFSPLSRTDGDSPSIQAPATLKNVNCTGILQNGWVPPDTHGAVGHTHYLQVVNSEIRAYLKSNLAGDVAGAPCAPASLSTSLNAFMGYFTQALFDPRAVYDPQWKRFIVTAVAFPENPTTQYHFVAISKTSSPTAGWWIYKMDMNFSGYSRHRVIPSIINILENGDKFLCPSNSSSRNS